MKVRCPSNTRAINAPRGFVQTRISPKKIAICKTPMLVIKVSSELLRTEKRVDQVNKQPQRRDSSNDVIHVFPLLQLVAGLREDPANQQKCTANSYVEQVEHLKLLRFLQNYFVTCTPQAAGPVSFSLVGHQLLRPPRTTRTRGSIPRSEFRSDRGRDRLARWSPLGFRWPSPESDSH